MKNNKMAHTHSVSLSLSSHTDTHTDTNVTQRSSSDVNRCPLDISTSNSFSEKLNGHFSTFIGTLVEFEMIHKRDRKTKKKENFFKRLSLNLNL